MDWYIYLVAIVGSFIAGIVNTLAGSGSAITLTILTELIGLSPNLANGTNRIGVLVQTWLGSIAFYKNGKLDITEGKRYIIPTIIGAILGVLVAVYVSNEQFKTAFSYLMIAMLFVILIKPKRWLRETDTKNPPSLWISIPLFIALGFYGGFIQMGMGVFYLGAMVLIAKYNIIEANAIKTFGVAIYTIVVIAIFQYKGLIDWYFGLLLALGQGAGGWVAATYASRYEKAGIWAYRLLIVVVVWAILRLFDIL